MTSKTECLHQITPVGFLDCEKLGVGEDSYAQMPTPVKIGDSVRVFFSNRNNTSQSTIRFADLKSSNLLTVQSTGKLNFDLGSPGSFDDNGQMPSSIDKIGEKWFLYFIGWNRSLSVPYRLSIGLAQSLDLTNFEKISEGPIMDRSIDNPFFVTTPDVKFVESKFEMYYSRGNGWEQDGSGFESKYSIARAESQDGIKWENFTTLDIGNTQDYCIARPISIGKHLIYSRRPALDFRKKGNGYRIEFASRHDSSNYTQCSIIWNQDSPYEQDASYACPIEIDGRWFIFFNGEGFGKKGIHVATLSGSF